ALHEFADLSMASLLHEYNAATSLLLCMPPATSGALSTRKFRSPEQFRCAFPRPHLPPRLPTACPIRGQQQFLSLESRLRAPLLGPSKRITWVRSISWNSPRPV